MLDLQPYIRRAWYDYMRPENSLHNRVIFDYEIMYVKEGSATVIIDGEKYEAVPGTLFFFRPKQPHSIIIEGDKPLCQPHIHFDLTYYPDKEDVYVCLKSYDQLTEEEKKLFRPDILQSYFPFVPSCVHLKDTAIIEQLLFDVIFAFNNPVQYNEINLQWRFLHLFWQLLQEVSMTKQEETIVSQKANGINTAFRIKAYLETNLQQNITLEQLSQMFFLDKSYLGRLFKKVYGTSPISYHRTLRIEKSKEMLIYTNLHIVEVARNMGFGSTQNYIRIFQQVTGMSPSDFRKMSAPLRQ